MVDADRRGIEVLTQINAVGAAMHQVDRQIRKDDLFHCVADAFAGGDSVEQKHKGGRTGRNQWLDDEVGEMPERAAHVAKTIAAGLMFLAVLMLSGGQIPFEASGDAFHAHAHAARLVADAGAGSTSAPCANHCDHHGHGLACCVASCMVTSPTKPTQPFSAAIPSVSTVVYRGFASSDLIGVIQDKAFRTK
jgi:hypothetical protein